MPSIMPSTHGETNVSSSILETPPHGVSYRLNHPQIVTRENNNDDHNLNNDSFQGSNCGSAPRRNLATEFPREPLPATHHIRMVRAPKEWLPLSQQCLYRDYDYTTFYDGVFTHYPALVYDNIDQLISDLTPKERQLWRSTIMYGRDQSEEFNGMVARFLPSSRLSMLPMKGTSLEEHSEDIVPFMAGEDFRAEHLTELSIEKYQRSQPNTDENDIYQHALFYKSALEEAYSRIHLELYDEPLPPGFVCDGIARTTGFVMPELGVQNETLSMPGGDEGGDSPPETYPCVRLYNHSAISGLSITSPALSQAELLKRDKIKRADKIKSYLRTMAFADTLIGDNQKAKQGTPECDLFIKGIQIRHGVLKSAERLGIDNRGGVRSKYKQRAIKGILKARAHALEQELNCDGGCKIILMPDTKIGLSDSKIVPSLANERTCLLDAVISILPSSANSAEIEKSIKMLMPKKGDTSIAVAGRALSEHGFKFDNVTSGFIGIKGSAAFHILQVKDCRYILNLKLTNLDGLSTSHFIAYDGAILHDQDVSCEVYDYDRETVKRCKSIFRRLYGKDVGFDTWQITGVWSLIPSIIIDSNNSGPSVANERTCLLDAVISILPSSANSAEIERSIKMLMPKKGDTSIAVAGRALHEHGFRLDNITSGFIGIKGSAAFHILQVTECRYILKLKLINLDGLSTSHFIAYDGLVLHDQDVSREVYDFDRETVKRCNSIFHGLYGKDVGFDTWQLTGVWRLVLPNIANVSSEVRDDTSLVKLVDKLML